jgi:hypothetical protein
MSAEDRIERARLLYERAVYGGDASALETADRELDAVEADLALARGRVIHTRFLAQLGHLRCHAFDVSPEFGAWRVFRLVTGMTEAGSMFEPV